jgi:hypothetical protein
VRRRGHLATPRRPRWLVAAPGPRRKDVAASLIREVYIFFKEGPPFSGADQPASLPDVGCDDARVRDCEFGHSANSFPSWSPRASCGFAGTARSGLQQFSCRRLYPTPPPQTLPSGYAADRPRSCTCSAFASRTIYCRLEQHVLAFAVSSPPVVRGVAWRNVPHCPFIAMRA